jgi:C4-type Zn-finger protein
MSKHDKYSDTTKLMYWQLWLTQTQKYKHKIERLEEWMTNDRLRQEKYDSASEPLNILCPSCKAVMKATDTKHLEDYSDQPIRVMFLFRCSKCKKQEWVYENGEIRESKPDLCPKCGKEIDLKHVRKGKVITITKKCKSCGYTEKEVDDFEKSNQEYLKREQADKELLEKHRAAFCLTDEIGEKYLFELEAMEYAQQIHESAQQKYNNDAYVQVSRLKKLTIVELEKILTKSLEKENYHKLSFASPEINQFIYAPFTLQDNEPSRRENISTSTLEKLLKNTLEGTNWRLTDRVSYRLGFLSGRLKGYEREEDMVKLYENKKEPQKPIDQDKRMKYGSSNWVRFAEMRGEQEGIEAARKRRLEKEPEGFFLDKDTHYNCGICYEGHYGNEIWWNLDGTRCADCWQNIKKGIIPPLKKHLFDNDGEWISNSQLKSDYNVTSPLARKLRKEGTPHGRELKRSDGSTYCTIYLVNENKEFLNKYPKNKKEVNRSILSLDITGHVVQLGETPSNITTDKMSI